MKFRAGFVALAGIPNVGKSTLLNTLLGAKVSITSEKPQTTRRRVNGILTTDKMQCIFVDPPGKLKSTSGLNRFLQDEFMDVIRKADGILLLLAADQNEKSAEELIQLVENQKKPWRVLITKADLLQGTRTPRFFQTLVEKKIPFVSISATKSSDEAKRETLALLEELLPESPGPLYDDELYTTQSLRDMAAEFVRESAFAVLHQEIPYGLAVRITEFKEASEQNPLTRISADLLLDKENHKSIVIGRGGQTLKEIGMQARKALEELLGNKVFIGLHVSVREDWTKNPKLMKELGYVVSE